MSLADELLADLEEMDDDGDAIQEAEMPAFDEAKPEIKGEFFKPAVPKTLTLDDVCKLRNSPQLISILEEIEKYSGKNRSSEDIQVIRLTFFCIKRQSFIFFCDRVR